MVQDLNEDIEKMEKTNELDSFMLTAQYCDGFA
jgi:hypothetical protein